MIKSKKGQVALEALVVFGILIIGVVIFGLFFMGNIKEITTTDPGTKQDKNTGGDVYDSLEGSLIYNDEQQIGSSSFGVIDVGGSGTDNPEDPPILFCGDGSCNNGETIITCAQDCFAGYFVTNLELELLPEDIAYTNTKITINATLESDAPLVQISQINIKKYDGDDYAYYETTDCGLTGYDNNYTYLNVGELLPTDPGFLTGSFDFFCNTPGRYRFIFSISNGTDTIENEIDKTITEPPALPTILVFDTTRDIPYGNTRDILLPLEPDGTYDFTVDWGDGTSNYIDAWDHPKKVHTYPTAGVYTVTITGTINGFNYCNVNNLPLRKQLIEIAQWGELRLGNNGRYFFGCDFEISATDVLDSPETTNMAYAFVGTNIIYNPSINNWDMSNVTDMTGMFYRSNFNAPISNWDTSNVTSMSEMFVFDEYFNQPIGNWDVSNVTDMSSMFSGANSFNQPLDWDTSNVTDMSEMFSGASSFNQPLNWNTSNVTNMSIMFNSAINFNQNISSWNVDNVLSWDYIFDNCPILEENKPERFRIT